jgi:hypothetical protein
MSGTVKHCCCNADGSLVHRGRVQDAADVLFNTACWGYVHLRHRHKWALKRARRQVARVLLDGFATAAAYV